MADDAVWERQLPEKQGQEELTQLSQVLSITFRPGLVDCLFPVHRPHPFQLPASVVIIGYGFH